MTNTAVCLNELERKQAASLLCFPIIYYKQSIGEDSRKGVRGGGREGKYVGRLKETRDEWEKRQNATIKCIYVWFAVCVCVWLRCPLTRESLGSACLALQFLPALEKLGYIVRWLTHPAQKSSQGLTHINLLMAKGLTDMYTNIYAQIHVHK